MRVIPGSSHLAFLLLLFLGQVYHVIAGSDLAHGAERALEYLNYLAEEEYDPGSGKTRSYTISPGCVGSRKNGRCTLAEFLLYNWKGNSKTKPTGYSTWPSIASDPTTETISDLVNKINSARFDVKTKRGVYFKPSTNIEPSKILPGTPQLDYFDILGEMGSRLNTLSTSRGDALSDYQKRIVELGKNAATAVHELRYEDNEKYRLNHLASKMPFKVETSPYTIKNFGRTFNRLDIVKTALNGGSGALGTLVAEDKNWRTTDASAKSHFKAILGARLSVMKATCSRILKL